MIQKVQSISFGNSLVSEIKHGLNETDVTKDEMIEGSVGVGSAAVIANAGHISNGLKGATNTMSRASKTATNFTKNKKTIKQAILGMLKSAEKYRILRPIAKFAQNKVVQKVAGGFSSLAAISFAIGDLANMLNVGSSIVETGKIPSMDVDG